MESYKVSFHEDVFANRIQHQVTMEHGRLNSPHKIYLVQNISLHAHMNTRKLSKKPKTLQGA